MEKQFQSLGWEDPLEKEMTAHSSILAWKYSWTEVFSNDLNLYFRFIVTKLHGLASSLRDSSTQTAQEADDHLTESKQNLENAHKQ